MDQPVEIFVGEDNSGNVRLSRLAQFVARVHDSMSNIVLKRIEGKVRKNEKK